MALPTADEDSSLFRNILSDVSSNYLTHSGLKISQNGIYLPLSFCFNTNWIVSSDQGTTTKIKEPLAKEEKVKYATTN